MFIQEGKESNLRLMEKGSCMIGKIMQEPFLW